MTGDDTDMTNDADMTNTAATDRLDALVWAFTELMLEPSYSGDQFSMIA